MTDFATDKQIKKLKIDAMETLETIDMDTLNKDNFMLIGASVAMLMYKDDNTNLTNHSQNKTEYNIDDSQTQLNSMDLNEFIKKFQAGEGILSNEIILAASLYILSTADPESITIRNIVNDTPVDEMLQHQIINLKGYMAAKKAYQLSMTDGNKIKMVAELEKMINLFSQVFSVLEQGTMCNEEREKLRKMHGRHVGDTV